MVSLLKSVLYTNMAVQRKVLKLMGDLVQGGEEFIDKKEAFFEEFFPRAQASEEKLENLLHDAAYKLSGRVNSSTTKNNLGQLEKDVGDLKNRLKKLEPQETCPKPKGTPNP